MFVFMFVSVFVFVFGLTFDQRRRPGVSRLRLVLQYGPQCPADIPEQTVAGHRERPSGAPELQHQTVVAAAAARPPLPKQHASRSARQQVSMSAGQQVSRSSALQHVNRSARQQVSGSARQQVSRSAGQHVSGSAGHIRNTNFPSRRRALTILAIFRGLREKQTCST